MARPSQYSPEFRANAVALVLNSIPPRSNAEVALELGVNRETLRFRVRRTEAEREQKPQSVGSRRGPAIELPVAGRGKLVEDDVSSGDHVLGKQGLGAFVHRGNQGPGTLAGDALCGCRVRGRRAARGRPKRRGRPRTVAS